MLYIQKKLHTTFSQKIYTLLLALIIFGISNFYIFFKFGAIVSFADEEQLKNYQINGIGIPLAFFSRELKKYCSEHCIYYREDTTNWLILLLDLTITFALSYILIVFLVNISKHFKRRSL
jgi:hypothetical protein